MKTVIIVSMSRNRTHEIQETEQALDEIGLLPSRPGQGVALDAHLALLLWLEDVLGPEWMVLKLGALGLLLVCLGILFLF